ncbi:hypothetical protein [Novosphingobium pentaromativorans]|uniref:hypothetical protein n=1 Tax=Novosphingobium pentaromativorans TaxID=205844 RepID=UPI0005865BE4|nr:hypothetical protein [Novosphingobium pentaromativorans]
MASLGVAIGDDSLDRGAGLSKKPERARAKKALAVLGDAVEKDQASEDSAFGRVQKAGVSGDDGVSRRHREDADALENGAASEKTDGDLRSWIVGQIVMLGDESARHAVLDEIDRIGSGVDGAEVCCPQGASFPPALAA